MNNERDKPDPGDDDRDDNSDDNRIVSMTYREIANENAPDALNRSILSQAAAAAKPRYARSMSWMRPMAWAATIGLSLAIVLEITQLPQPESPAFETSIDNFDSPAASSPQRDDRRTTEILEESDLPDMPSSEIEPDIARKSDAASQALLQAPQRVEVTEKKRATEPEPAVELQKASGAGVADVLDPKDSDFASSAEDLARPRSESVRASAPALQAEAYSPNAALQSVRSPGCDEEAIATPAAWLECIEELEKAGLSDAASEELEQMKQAFPEFVPR
jgi:hypothetical protein